MHAKQRFYSKSLNKRMNEKQVNASEKTFCLFRGEAAKLAHLIESASLKRKYMTKNYEKIFI